MNQSRKKIIGIVVLVLVIVAIPLTVWIAQRQQELRQRAAGEQTTLFFSEGDTCSSEITELGLTIGDEMTLSICLETNNFPVNGYDFKVDMGNLYDFADITPSEGSDAGVFEVPLHSEEGEDKAGKYIHFAKVSTQNVAGGTDATQLNLARLSLVIKSVGTGTLSIREDKQVTSPNVPDQSLSIGIQPLSYTIATITGPAKTCTDDNACPAGQVCTNAECTDMVCTTALLQECQQRGDHVCRENKPEGSPCNNGSGTCNSSGACVTATTTNPPSNLSATSTTNSITLAWAASTTPNVTYNLYRGYLPENVTLYRSDLTTTSFTDTTFPNLTADYWYHVTAKSSAGVESEPSNNFRQALAIAPTATVTPMPPTVTPTISCTRNACDSSCPQADCPAPPANCGYENGNRCSCGDLVCTPTNKASIVEDIDEDGYVDIIDFTLWRTAYQTNNTSGREDINRNNRVDLIDFNRWLIKFKEYAGNGGIY